MKKWILCGLLLMSSVMFPMNTEAKISSNNSNLELKGPSDNRSLAVNDDNLYYVNSGLLNMKQGIYKVSKDLKKYKLIIEGDYQNIYIYRNSIITFNYKENVLQQISFEGRVIKEYPEVTSSVFLVNGNYIYYQNLESNELYQIKVNGTNNKFLFKPKKGTIQEFTVNNDWLYVVYEIYLSDKPSEMESKEYLSKIKISNPSKEFLLVKDVYNVDSVIVKDGYIYAIIHKTAASTSTGRFIYRMNYSGENLKQISTMNLGGSIFVGSKYIYFIDNSFNDNQKFYRMTMNGKNIKEIATIPGRPVAVSTAYANGIFYFEVQKFNASNFNLHKIVIR